jgi:hypothetical protein
VWLPRRHDSKLTLALAFLAADSALIGLRRSYEVAFRGSAQESAESSHHGLTPPSEADYVSTEIAALAPIYTADRADNSAGEVFTILGAGAAYITATLAFSGQIFRSIGLLGPFLPLPLWIMVAYQSLLTGAAMVRSLSIRAIESKLLNSTDFSKLQAQAIGLQSSERVLNVNDASFVHKVISFATYGGIVLMVCAYTVFVISTDPDIANTWRIVAYTGYAFLAILVVASHCDNIRLYKRSNEQLAHQVGA